MTIYFTSADPGDAIESMTVYREVLIEAGRMDNAGNRAVRTGDAMDLSWMVADPSLMLDPRDMPYVAHRGIRVVLRRGAPDDGRTVAERAVSLDGVLATMSFASRFFPGIHADIYLLEDVAECTARLRAGAPYDEVDVVLDAPFSAIIPFDYSFADRIRGSDLPQILDTDQVI